MDANLRVIESQRLRNNLQRQQSHYDALVSLFQTVELNKNMEQEKITVLDAPSPGQPVERYFFLSIHLAAVGGLFLGLGIVFGWYVFDDRFVSVRDVQEQFGEVVLGLVPQVKVPRRRPLAALIQADDPRLAYVESYRHLRSALLLSQPGGTPAQTLLFTGAGPGEGKTTVAVNLARVLASSGLRVALVDADARRGGIHRWLDAEESPGVLDFLRGQASVEEVIHPTKVPGLAFVPSGAHPGQADGLFMRPALGNLLAELKKDRDFVILDAPPLLFADDAALLVPYSDAVLVVVRPFYTRSSLVRRTMEMLRQRQAKNITVIFNRAGREDLSGYYSHYGLERPAKSRVVA